MISRRTTAIVWRMSQRGVAGRRVDCRSTVFEGIRRGLFNKHQRFDACDCGEAKMRDTKAWAKQKGQDVKNEGQEWADELKGKAEDVKEWAQDKIQEVRSDRHIRDAQKEASVKAHQAKEFVEEKFEQVEGWIQDKKSKTERKAHSLIDEAAEKNSRQKDDPQSTYNKVKEGARDIKDQAKEKLREEIIKDDITEQGGKSKKGAQKDQNWWKFW